MRKPAQISIGAYFKDNHGPVTITNGPGRPKKPPAESKGPPKPIRFLPRDAKNIENAVRAEWDSFQEFAEFWCATVGTVYSRDAAEKLSRHFNILSPILDQLP